VSDTTEFVQHDAAPTADAASRLAEASNAMVRLYKEQLGRGPTRVRTSYAGRDCVVCVLEDTLTAAERTLTGLGEHDRLRDMRSVLQLSAEAEFRRIVETALDRRVRSFLSSFDPKTGAAAEVFLLEPDGAG
jgi:uncharacterized protein YbcI